MHDVMRGIFQLTTYIFAFVGTCLLFVAFGALISNHTKWTIITFGALLALGFVVSSLYLYT